MGNVVQIQSVLFPNCALRTTSPIMHSWCTSLPRLLTDPGIRNRGDLRNKWQSDALCLQDEILHYGRFLISLHVLLRHLKGEGLVMCVSVVSFFDQSRF